VEAGTDKDKVRSKKEKRKWKKEKVCQVSP